MVSSDARRTPFNRSFLDWTFLSGSQSHHRHTLSGRRVVQRFPTMTPRASLGASRMATRNVTSTSTSWTTIPTQGQKFPQSQQRRWWIQSISTWTICRQLDRTLDTTAVRKGRASAANARSEPNRFSSHAVGGQLCALNVLSGRTSSCVERITL